MNEFGPRPQGEPGSNRAEVQPWDPAYYPNAGYYGYGYPAAYPPPVPPKAPRRRRGIAIAAAAVVAAAALFGAGVAIGRTDNTSGTGTIAAGQATPGSGNSSNPGSGSSNGSGNGSGGSSNPFGRYPFGNSGGNSTQGRSQATAAQSTGVVDIYSQLGYQSSEAAGTGLVLTSDGEVLTNNHVIDGSTKLRIVVVSTGKTYTAKVIGDVPTKDIALIQLQNASGLQTANLGDSSTVNVGDSVTGVGNAGGVGGTPSAAAGKVTALHKTITASDENGSSAEKLHDVIVTNAPIQPGDSGGPLYNSANEVIGVDTAASTSARVAGFAIPINDAMALVKQIRTGVETSSVHIGYPGFMGIEMLPKTHRPFIYSVISGGPAAKAGLESGDLITAVDGTKVGNQTQLRNQVSTRNPGTTISITYKDSTGSHTASVTLIAGPAD